jgi:hypothetical protein
MAEMKIDDKVETFIETLSCGKISVVVIMLLLPERGIVVSAECI